MINKLIRLTDIIILTILSLVFAVHFAGPKILKMYVETGIGNCRNIPILCKGPNVRIEIGDLDKNATLDFLPYKFSRMKVMLPKGFNVVQERIKKFYYKRKHTDFKPTVYLLRQNAGFFVNLFPQVTKKDVLTDYDFLYRTMNADINGIQNVIDMFFVIMKSIFTPNLGDQNKVVMAEFQIENKRGFINYNLGEKLNLFDCNIFDEKGNFYKIYIKDIGAKLDLNKVYGVISTVEVNP